jgi:hypothetical protein
MSVCLSVADDQSGFSTLYWSSVWSGIDGTTESNLVMQSALSTVALPEYVHVHAPSRGGACMFYLGSTPRDVEGQGSLFAGFEEGKLQCTITYVTQLLDHSRTDLHLV